MARLNGRFVVFVPFFIGIFEGTPPLVVNNPFIKSYISGGKRGIGPGWPLRFSWIFFGLFEKGGLW